VKIDNIISESNVGVSLNLRRKAVACEEMFAAMVDQMNNAMKIRRYTNHTKAQEMPSWL
jgi:hypothetical protein